MQTSLKTRKPTGGLVPMGSRERGIENGLNDHKHLIIDKTACQALPLTGLATIDANVIDGNLKDAEWLALTANKEHGMRRSNEDKRRVVELALNHPNGAKLSNSQIAEHCGVSHFLVGKIRPSILNSIQDTMVTIGLRLL